MVAQPASRSHSASCYMQRAGQVPLCVVMLAGPMAEAPLGASNWLGLGHGMDPSPESKGLTRREAWIRSRRQGLQDSWPMGVSLDPPLLQSFQHQ